MTPLLFLLIIASLITLVAGQLLLKKAMEPHTAERMFTARGLRFLVAGTAAMAISFFLTLGLLSRLELSYLYPFQGLSVVIISASAAIFLRERLTLRLLLGALLISAGVALVSTS